jgi:hypothetical protein
VIRAVLTLDGKSRKIDLNPATVSADSIMPIKKLIRDNGRTAFA